MLKVLLSDNLIKRWVWAIWLLMVGVAFLCIAKYGRDIPLCEDWLLVPPLTGYEPNLAHWLWEQNNEHRTPLLRLILLGLLAVFKDFRAGMVVNVVILGGLSFWLIRMAQHLRGKPSFADAFFPIALLHLGNWENITYTWQIHFTVPFALICYVLLAIIDDPSFKSRWTVLAIAACLVAFPLCGGIGLIFVPGLIVWVSYCSTFFFGKVNASQNVDQPWKGWVLRGAVVISILLIVAYFIGYEKPTWNPPSPSLVETLKTIAKFVALGFGPVVARSWEFFVFLAFGLLLPTIFLVGSAVIHRKGDERHQVLGLLFFFMNLGLFTIAMGWSRAGLVPILGGLPPRYVHLAVPILLAIFFTWELYGRLNDRFVVQHVLLAMMLFLLPFNTLVGFQEWGSWYRHGMAAFEQDMAAGTSYELLAKRHKEFLIPWWDDSQLVLNMQRLEETDIGPFGQRHR